MERGLIHVYYGDGKGKTTAAIGLAVRAAGAGKQIIFAQFLKGGVTGELKSLEKLPNIRIFRNQEDLGFFKNMTPQEKEKAAFMHTETLKNIILVLKSQPIDMLILDEITYPYEYGIIDKAMLEHLIFQKPKSLELILTGRNPSPFFLEAADYVTEMKKIKHPFDKKIMAREGIEY